jgi:hypothetical protein
MVRPRSFGARQAGTLSYDYADAALHDTQGLLAALHFYFSERSSHNEADRFFADLMSVAGLPAKTQWRC